MATQFFKTIAKKLHINRSTLPIILPLLFVLAGLVYVGITQGILLSLFLPPIVITLVFAGGYYAYKSIKNYLDKRKQTKIAKSMNEFEGIVISEPNRPFVPKGPKAKSEYHYQAKPEAPAEPKHYKPSDTPNQDKKLPNALLQSIAEHLTPREVALLKQSDKKLDQSIDFTKHSAIEPHLDDLGTPDQTKAEKFEIFKAACDEIKKTYSQDLIDICGIHVLAALPVLTLEKDYRDHHVITKTATTFGHYSESDYIDDITVDQLKGHRAMRGVDNNGRPFISLCLRVKGEKDPYVVTVFQRYSTDIKNWQVGGNRAPTIFAFDPLITPHALFKSVAAIFQGTHPGVLLVEPKAEDPNSRKKSIT